MMHQDGSDHCHWSRIVWLNSSLPVVSSAPRKPNKVNPWVLQELKIAWFNQTWPNKPYCNTDLHTPNPIIARLNLDAKRSGFISMFLGWLSTGMLSPERDLLLRRASLPFEHLLHMTLASQRTIEADLIADFSIS